METGKEVKPQVEVSALGSALDEATKEGKETANKVTLSASHDNTIGVLEFNIRDLILARKPSSTGSSKGCMLTPTGCVLKDVEIEGRLVDIVVSAPRGGWWATIDIKASKPKTMTAGQ